MKGKEKSKKGKREKIKSKKGNLTRKRERRRGRKTKGGNLHIKEFQWSLFVYFKENMFYKFNYHTTWLHLVKYNTKATQS